MSRKYNATGRLLNAYQKYIGQLAKRTAVWARKGYMPVDPGALSFSDFVANREYLRGKGVASGNLTRTIISQQLYAFSQAQAANIVDKLAELGVTVINGQKVTVEAVKGGLGNAALSVLNDELKAQGVQSGYERAQWITENIYEDSM